MTGVPDKAVESVRSDGGAIFGCGWRSYAKVGHLVGRSHFGKSGQDTGGEPDTHGTHTGHAGAQRHTDHAVEPHNHPNPPTKHIPQLGNRKKPGMGQVFPV